MNDTTKATDSLVLGYTYSSTNYAIVLESTPYYALSSACQTSVHRNMGYVARRRFCNLSLLPLSWMCCLQAWLSKTESSLSYSNRFSLSQLKWTNYIWTVW